MKPRNVIDDANAAAAARKVREHVAQSAILMRELEQLIERLSEEPTWSVAGSLGHINEVLEQVMSGFPRVPKEADDART